MPDQNFVKLTLTLTKAQYDTAKAEADEQGVSIQDYIRQKAFGTEPDIFTPSEAVRRAMLLQKGTCFSIPALYGESWTLRRGAAGVFGRQFFQYVTKYYANEFEHIGKIDGRNAHYRKLI